MTLVHHWNMIQDPFGFCIDIDLSMSLKVQKRSIFTGERKIHRRNYQRFDDKLSHLSCYMYSQVHLDSLHFSVSSILNTTYLLTDHYVFLSESKIGMLFRIYKENGQTKMQGNCSFNLYTMTQINDPPTKKKS